MLVRTDQDTDDQIVRVSGRTRVSLRSPGRAVRGSVFARTSPHTWCVQPRLGQFAGHDLHHVIEPIDATPEDCRLDASRTT